MNAEQKGQQEQEHQVLTVPEWRKWADRAANAAVRCDEIPEAGEDFAVSVQEKLERIADKIERLQHVTREQQRAIENMEHGIERWLGE